MTRNFKWLLMPTGDEARHVANPTLKTIRFGHIVRIADIQILLGWEVEASESDR